MSERVSTIDSVPVVCRSCGRATDVQLASLQSTVAVICGACGASVDVSTVRATLPARIVRSEQARRAGPRPLSEFP